VTALSICVEAVVALPRAREIFGGVIRVLASGPPANASLPSLSLSENGFGRADPFLQIFRDLDGGGLFVELLLHLLEPLS
jgi:hypothetical protein